jgi:uncharacterized membrane protein
LIGWFAVLLLFALTAAVVSVATLVAVASIGLALALLLPLALVALWLTGRGFPSLRSEPSSPAQLLRLRYARGEITQRQFQDALVDLLKERYVSGELGLQEFEDELTRVLTDRTPARSNTGHSSRLA